MEFTVFTKTFASVAGVVLILTATLSGCAKSTPAPAAAPSAETVQAAEDPNAAEIREALAKLPDEDRKLAEAQKICPIGKSPLGGMGVPIKVDVGGKAVFICCEGCRKALLADYEKKADGETPPAVAN